MPELNLEKDHFCNFFWVYAVMAHPNCERYQQEFVAAQVTKCILDSTNEDDDIEIPKTILSVLVNAPSYEEITGRAQRSASKGAIAGDVLDYIAQMQLTGYKEPSVRKAVFVAEGYFSNAIDGYGKKGGASDITIRKYWEEYKTVAHLWAAFRVCQLTPNKEFPKLQETLFGDKLDDFLAIAEGFRLFGENFKSIRNKSHESLLPKDETWKVSQDYALPETYLSIQELPAWMTERLKKFKNKINI